MAPPSRSARAAVLASSVQRSKPTPYPSKARSALIRRTIVVVLVLVALTLITISFRSPTAGALHDIQGAGSTALRPFQVAATRVAQPFRDAYDYVHSLANAKAENKQLKKENQALRESVFVIKAQISKYPDYAKLLHLEQLPTLKDFRTVNAEVITTPGSPFAHTVTIAAGSSSGIRINAPVVSGGGLVGHVSNVFPDEAIVTLLTDTDSFVAARDISTGVRGGGVRPGTGGTLILDQVPKQDVVNKGDAIVTDGTRNARYPDIYPYGIPIGRVSSVGVTDTAAFLQVQVQPFANLGSVEVVGVLIATKHGR